MDFFVFLLVNATLFIRPSEITPDLAALPIYNVLISTCLVVASPKLIRRLTERSPLAEPITACVLGLLATIVLSLVPPTGFSTALGALVDFGKVVLYYLLMVAVLDTPARLIRFLVAVVLFVLILTVLALLQYHGLVDIPSLAALADGRYDDATGVTHTVIRLRSTGIYNDPNDLSLILVMGMGASLFLATPSSGRLPQPAWLAPIVVFLYALTLTYSRGGFVSLLGGMMVLFIGRFGVKKGAALATVALPAMFFLFAGRQTEISADDTGQDRIQLWAAGFAMFRGSPLLGVGYNLYPEQAGQVAHNSYIHAYGELGFLGGTLFLGAFAYAILTLLGLGRRDVEIRDPDLRRLRPFLLAILSAYACGMLSLSRNYVVPTYLILGLATAYLNLVVAGNPQLAGPGEPLAPVGRRMLVRAVLGSAAFFAVANVFVKVFIRYS